MAITYQGGNKKSVKKNRTALIIGCCVAFFGVIVLVALGIWTYTKSHLKADKFGTPEEVAQAFAEKLYAGDAMGIFSMQPENMQARSQQDTEMTYAETEGNLEAVVEQQRADMDVYLAGVKWAHGDDWSADFSVGSYAKYSDDEIQSLQMSYRMMGVGDDFKLDEAGYVPVTATLSGKSGSESSDVIHYVPVVKVKGDWYIGQEYGEEYAEVVGGDIMTATMTGDLLDGYHVVGEFDAEGERVYRTEDGIQVMKDEKGDYYYEDSYGNKHYCEYKVLNIYGQVEITKETKVVGPHGGEELTSETYEEYWDNYYAELAAQYESEGHGHIHEDAVVSGNSVGE